MPRKPRLTQAEVARFLKRWRAKRGYTQVRAAKFISAWVPCSRRTWQRWEAGEAPIWLYGTLKD